MPAYVPGRSAAAAMADHDLISAVKLASNESSLGPLPAAAKAIEAAAGQVNRYPDNRATELRSALAEHLGVDTSMVTVGCGSVGLIQQLCLAFAGPGRDVVYARPSFEAYPVFTRLSGSGAVEVPLRRQTIDAGALAACFADRTTLALVATPNNPTGTALRADELLALADVTPEHCLLVVDAAYQEFVTGADVPDPVELLAGRPNVVVLRTFSKAYGLAALRVGYMIGPAEIVEAVDKVALPFTVGAVSQAAAVAALGERSEMEARVASVVAERARVTAELRGRGFMVPDSQANFVWLPAARSATDLGVALERRGVVTRAFPGVGVRVTVGQPEENDLFLGAFDAAAEEAGASEAWGLPTGQKAGDALGWLQRLEDAETTIVEEAGRSHEGLTEPDPGAEERWDDGQVWGHLAEFGAYWLHQLDSVIDGQPQQPFGRTKADEDRKAAVAAGPRQPVEVHLETIRRAMDALRARLAELTAEDWEKAGTHSTLGVMTIADQLQHFHIGHYEEHAAQLAGLAQ
jgi:histidinol-phosphate aminotransferase